MKFPKVSLIVPVYKVEPYIERCLASIVAQTYPHIECILIDDASPDHSVELAKHYLKNQGKAYTILHQPANKGLSAARNTGIDAASGDYLYFLDSDDEIAPNAIERLVTLALQTQAEITVGQNVVAREDGTMKHIFPISAKTDIIESTAAILRALNTGAYPVMACDKLISTSFLKTHDLYFEPGLLSEDELWSFQCALNLNKIAFLKGGDTYLYYFRFGSIIQSKDKRHFNSFQKIAERFDQEYHKTADPQIKKLILEHLISFKDMALIMNWQSQFSEHLWKESYLNFKQLSTLSLLDFFSKDFSLQTKKKAFYTSLPVNLGYKLFRKRYGK